MEKNKGGRPRLFDTPEELEAKAQEYFTEKECQEKPFTIAGLCYHLGFSDRKALTEYVKYDGFSDTVKRIRLKIEEQKNELLLCGHGSATGVIFDLKNNHNWKDKVETDLTSAGEKLQSIPVHTFVSTQAKKEDEDNETNDRN